MLAVGACYVLAEVASPPPLRLPTPRLPPHPHPSLRAQVLLFFVPQLLNFVYSLPQLFRLVPCPRHRMPAYIQAEDKVCASFAVLEPSELSGAGRLVLRLCASLKLAKVESIPGSTSVRMSNLTIINFVLYVCGPMHEARLATTLLVFQAACNALALLVRYQLAGVFYDVVR